MYDIRGSDAKEAAGWPSTCSILPFSDLPTVTILSLVSILIAPTRWYADSGMKKSTRSNMSTIAPPMACMAMRKEPFSITDPAIGPARFYDKALSVKVPPKGEIYLTMPPSTPRLKMAILKPRSCTCQISATDAGMSASNGAILFSLASWGRRRRK